MKKYQAGMVGTTSQEVSKLKTAGAASLQRERGTGILDRENNNNSEMALYTKNHII